jgi:hypothetical protein
MTCTAGEHMQTCELKPRRFSTHSKIVSSFGQNDIFESWKKRQQTASR